MLDCLAHLALAGLTALAWLGAGSLVLAPLGTTGDRALDGLNRFGAGAVAFALLTFAAGWLELLYAAAYVPLLVAAAVCGGVALARLVHGTPPPRPSTWPRWQLALAGLVVAYVVAGIAVTCAPISSADALFYHANAPKLFEQAHQIQEIPWAWQSYQPFTVELLVLDGFLLWDSVQGAFAPLLLALATAGVVFATARNLAGRGSAILATAIFFAQPFALWLETSTFVESGAALTVALAVANLIRFAQVGRTELLVLAGLFTGATAGIKYIAAGAAAVLAVSALVVFRRRLTARRALAFALPAALVALPWYVKNLIVTGDPLYPLLGGWPNDEARAAARDSFDNYGRGHSPLDLLLLPVRLLVDGEPFDRAEFISPLFLLFAPLSLLVAGARRAAVPALVGVAAYVVVWFVNVQDSRYLLFAMPVLAVAAAVGITGLAARSRAGRVVATTVTAGALVAGAGASAVYASQFVSVTSGRQSEDAFLDEVVSYHESVAWINAHLPPEARVAVAHVFLLHIERPALTWNADALPGKAGSGETRAFFRRYGLTHAVIFPDPVKRRQLRYVGATRVARITVHPVTSRALSRSGPAETMEVYRVAPRLARAPEAPSASERRRSSDGRGRATMKIW
jgi:hypothetical protein